jgi:hypothetical protein
MIDLRRTASLGLCFGVLSALALTSSACKQEEKKYQAKPAFSGKKPALPAVPTLPQLKTKEGEAYTVPGLIHDFRSRARKAEVERQKLTVVGYIVKTNYADAPDCAIHALGKEDKADCKSEPPSFWIAADKEGKGETIRVMGWASNWATVYSAIEEIDKAAKGKELEAKTEDQMYGVALPNPLPNVGARVEVTGVYGTSFDKGSAGSAYEPRNGIVTYESVKYLEPPPEKVYLKGMKPKK